MSIYSKTGDKGKTGLGNGGRVGKESLIIKTLGDLDELNCSLGLSVNFIKSGRTKKFLSALQNLIFNIGAEIAAGKMPSKRAFRHLSTEDTLNLEKNIDRLEKQLTPLRTFILPGGSKGASFLHLSRAVCRRAERNIVTLHKSGKIKNQSIPPFMNRLSDFLFVLARRENKRGKKSDVLWSKS